MVRTAELAAAAPDLDTVIVSVYIYRDGTEFVVPAVSELVGSFVIKRTHLSLHRPRNCVTYRSFQISHI